MADEDVGTVEEHLQDGAVDEAVDAVEQDPEGDGEQQAAGPWFSHGGRDFADAAALTEHLDAEVETGRRERLNQQSYAQQLSELNEQRRQFQQRSQEFERQQQDGAGWRERLQKLEDLYRTRPDVAKQIEEAIGQAPSADAMEQRIRAQLKKEYGPVLQDYENRKAREEEDRVISEVVGDKRVFPHGVQEDKMRAEIARLAEVAETGGRPALQREIITLAAKLYQNQAGAAAAAEPAASNTTVSDRPDGSRPSLMPASGSGAPVPPPESALPMDATFDEVMHQHLQEVG